MRSRLDDFSRPDFSKTARSRPSHHEAGWNRLNGAALPVHRRSFAHDLAEVSAECAQAGKSHIQANVGDTSVGRSKQEHRPLDPPSLEIPVWRFAKGGTEGPDEVRFGDVGDPSQGGDVERFGVIAIHRIACAEHPAVDLLDSAAQLISLLSDSPFLLRSIVVC
jgi:hypothetical protein